MTKTTRNRSSRPSTQQVADHADRPAAGRPRPGRRAQRVKLSYRAGTGQYRKTINGTTYYLGPDEKTALLMYGFLLETGLVWKTGFRQLDAKSHIYYYHSVRSWSPTSQSAVIHDQPAGSEAGGYEKRQPYAVVLSGRQGPQPKNRRRHGGQRGARVGHLRANHFLSKR